MSNTQIEGADVPSPLLEAQVESLDEIFSRDPEQLTEQDLTKVVTELRRQREKFLKLEETGAKTPRATKTAKEVLSLTDLGL